MASVSAKQRLEDMMRRYCMFWDTKLPEIEELSHVLSQLSNQQKIDMLQKEYLPGHTSLYYAALSDHTEILSTLLTSVQSADRMKLLLPPHTHLHTAALNGHTESVKVILDCLTAHQQLQIMAVLWDGKTPIQWAERAGRTYTAALLRDYQYRAEQPQRGEYATHRPLALILYNPLSRDGAVEEADNLQSGLKAVGCQVIREEWTTKPELTGLIDEGLQSADGCSLLMVCIMSHGRAGHLKCEPHCEGGASFIVINDILQKFKMKLPKDLPMVMMIQACQQSGAVVGSNDHDMAMGCSSEENNHIVLNRPHTMLLLSTMRDGFAKRGAYIDAIVHQFKRAGRKKNIYELHERAVLYLTKKYGNTQTPEIRSTLKKKIMLSNN